VQLLAPITIGSGVKNNLEINTNKAEAADCEFTAINFSPFLTNSNTSRPESVNLSIKTSGCIGGILTGEIYNNDEIDNEVLLFLANKIEKDVIEYELKIGEAYCTTNCTSTLHLEVNMPGLDTKPIEYNSGDIKEEHDSLVYKCKTSTCDTNNWSILSTTQNIDVLDDYAYTIESWYYTVKNKSGETIKISSPDTKEICESDRILDITNFSKEGAIVGDCVKAATTEFKKDPVNNSDDVSGLPVCFGPSSGGKIPYPHVGGCIAQLLYYALFVPTSYLFALSGTFFDFTFHYSVQDASYRTPFVVEGWGIVRDFCNMFFIFILLYIAFGTILKLHSVKTKEMIINVVIIGLLINFSLFATHIIIDASNILARVFYNSNTIKITQSDDAKNGVADATPGLKIGPNGEIPLSAAIVNKVNPQNLIINGRKAVKIQDKVTGETSDSTDTEGNLGAGAFILITILATAVNIMGLLTFLSIGLIFVARVIGLWIAMIFAPFAFFSYTVPALQGMEMVGWRKWWPETLKLAFLAPIFIFFMYLIIAFLEKGLSLIKLSDTSTVDGMTFVLSIIVPFIFIMILLKKAKDIAKTMSGTLGQSITGGVASVGGFALGAGIGGLAMAGRASIGRLANKANTSNWLNEAAAGKKGANPLSKFALQSFGKIGKKVADSTSKSSFDLRQLQAGNVLSKETGMNLNKGTNILGLDTKKGLGGYAGVQQRLIEKENKFAESLGYNHHKYVEVEDEIAKIEGNIIKEKRNKIDIENEMRNHKATTPINPVNGTKEEKEEYQVKMRVYNDKLSEISKRLGDKTQEINDLENGSGKDGQIKGLNVMKKDLERIKSGRAKEYALTMKRRSGQIYKHVARDINDNIIKFGHAEASGKQAVKQILTEFAKGMAQGAGVGAVAGSVVPGVGTLGGAVGGGLIGAVRSTIKYSGTTNRKIGEVSHGDKHEAKDKYVPPVASHSAPADSHGGDSHGGDEHGGGGHH